MPSSACLPSYACTSRERAPIELGQREVPSPLLSNLFHFVAILWGCFFVCTSDWTQVTASLFWRKLVVRCALPRGARSSRQGIQISAWHRKCIVTITGGVTGATGNNRERQGWRNTTLATRYDELNQNLDLTVEFSQHLRLRKCSLNQTSVYLPSSASQKLTVIPPGVWSHASLLYFTALTGCFTTGVLINYASWKAYTLNNV